MPGPSSRAVSAPVTRSRHRAIQSRRAWCTSRTRLSVTVDLAIFTADAVHVRWYDPTTGGYTNVGDFTTTGTQVVAHPGNNASGQPDWVLVVEGSLMSEPRLDIASNASRPIRMMRESPGSSILEQAARRRRDSNKRSRR